MKKNSPTKSRANRKSVKTVSPAEAANVKGGRTDMGQALQLAILESNNIVDAPASKPALKPAPKR